MPSTKPVANTVTVAVPSTIAPTHTTQPAVKFITPMPGQTPVAALQVFNQSAGEQPQILVRMKDGTCAYIPDNKLTQDGSVVVV